MRFCVTVSGRDRPGIIAAVTLCFYRHRGSLQDVTMSILCGEFAMMLIVSFAHSRNVAMLKSNLKQLEKRLKLSIHMQAISKRQAVSDKNRLKYLPYYISIFGEDRIGIVHQVSQLLAKQGLNITDLNSKLIPMGKKKIYGLALEVDIPRRKNTKTLESALRKIVRSLNADLVFKPVEPLTL